MDPLFEQKIIKGMKNKEEWAFESFVENYQKEIYNIALRMSGNEEDAMDITQEVFLKIFRKIDTFLGNSKLSTWIYRITINYSKDYISTRSRHSHISMDKSLETEDGTITQEYESKEKNPMEIIEQNHDQQLLVGAINKLEKDQREIIILRYINELSYQEISDILEIPEGTIKSRLNRARNKLAEILKSMELF